MGRKLVTSALICVLSVSTGCAPTSQVPKIDPELAKAEAYKQRVAALRWRAEQSARVYDVAFRLMESNAELCGERLAYRAGVMFHTLENYEDDWHEPARDEFGVGEYPTILHTVPDSPARNAKLLLGDEVLKINDMQLAKGVSSTEVLVKQIGESEGERVTLSIRRGNEEQDIAFEPIQACDYAVHILEDDTVNAYADGEQVFTTTGLIYFVDSDDELALVIGHELAHNTRGHIDAKRGNALIGVLVGTLIAVTTGIYMVDPYTLLAAEAFSQRFEAEADYVGVYMTTRAGYDVSDAATFWRRMATIHPDAIHLPGSTHPSTATRFLAIESATEEVRLKSEGNLPLVPEESTTAEIIGESPDEKSE